MSTTRIGIFGASGFVGSTLCERLFLERRNVVAFVHTSGNAARLARFQIDMRPVDLMRVSEVKAAVSDCGVIVNCSRGSRAVMTRGLHHVLTAVRQAKVRTFVHLSSLGIYGDNPEESSRTEAGRPVPESEYGRIKLQQDEWVLQLQRSGVQPCILCPDNIAGPYSLFVLALATRLANGAFPLVDGGRYPTNIVHVDNVVQAIVAAIDSHHGAGERYFVNEQDEISWKRYCQDLAGLLGVNCVFTDISRQEVLTQVGRRAPRAGLVDHVRIACSGEFRRGLALMPAVARLNDAARSVFDALPAQWQAALRARLERPVVITKPTTWRAGDESYLRLQLRRFHHSPEKLRCRLGFRPALTYGQGMETTAAWLRAAGAGRPRAIAV
jgi:nucleoside-diphosphate-sugar epimerase